MSVLPAGWLAMKVVTPARGLYLLLAIVASLVVLLLISTSAGAAPTITTDKPDYNFFETVTVTGGGFSPGSYDVPVLKPGEVSPAPGWDTAVADGSGSFTYLYQLGALAGLYEVRAYASPWSGDWNESPVASVTFTDAPPSISLEQCRNGPSTTPNDCADLGGGTGWVTGNVGPQQGHIVEGYSIPYRAIMENLPTGMPITVDLGYDIKHSDKHAVDFLTHYDRLEPHGSFGHSAENVTPTSGVSGISGTTDTTAIDPPSSVSICPSPVLGQPTTRFNSLPVGERDMTLFGGTFITTIDDLEFDYVSEDCLTGAVAETVVRVSFTVDSATAVLAWGGHVGRALDWGAGNSAGGISGSPYHMRLIDWSLGSIGQQDRSLSADAIDLTGEITIVKDTVPDGPTDFSFTDDIPDCTVGPLDDDGNGALLSSVTCSNVAAGTYLVTEDDPTPDFDLTALNCDDANSTEDVGTRTATINLEAGETVTCTFTNTLRSDTFTVNKVYSDATTTPVTITLSCTSGSIVSNPLPASPGSPAVFTVNGASSGATCTATESGVPVTHTADDSDCQDNDLLPGSCTMVNTLNEATFKVTKTFSDGNLAEVTITLSCDSGTVTPSTSESTTGQMVTFTIRGFTHPGTDCTATESNVPTGYNTANGNCFSVGISPGNQSSCTIINSIGAGGTPHPVGGVVGLVGTADDAPGSEAQSGGSVALLIALAAGAAVAIAGASVWIARLANRR